MPLRRLANTTAMRRLDAVRKKRGRGICTPRPFRDGAPHRLDRIAWWAVRDSNPHSLRNQILSLARLPIPPTARITLLQATSYQQTTSNYLAILSRSSASDPILV